MTGDLDRSRRAHLHDDDLLVLLAGSSPVDADPHGLTEQPSRDGVLATLEGDHRCGRRHGPGHPERDGVRGERNGVEAGVFLGEHLDRGPPRDPVHPRVDVVPELFARGLQVGERGVLLAQVRVLGDQVSLGDLDRRLGPALGAGSAGTQVWIVMP